MLGKEKQGWMGRSNQASFPVKYTNEQQPVLSVGRPNLFLFCLVWLGLWLVIKCMTCAHAQPSFRPTKLSMQRGRENHATSMVEFINYPTQQKKKKRSL